MIRSNEVKASGAQAPLAAAGAPSGGGEVAAAWQVGGGHPWGGSSGLQGEPRLGRIRLDPLDHVRLAGDQHDAAFVQCVLHESPVRLVRGSLDHEQFIVAVLRQRRIVNHGVTTCPLAPCSKGISGGPLNAVIGISGEDHATLRSR
ncbi:MAG: hypothetical protein QF723_02915, partial [Phycisphaerales bacterium]|nr:hypothetical protein [Phycisphaerales bacterium]